MSDRFRIAAVRARQVLDSRAAPTVEADVLLEDGAMGRASVPSGASTGAHEARELRDRGSQTWAGRGVTGAVANVTRACAPAVRGLDARDQEGLDAALRRADGTENFARLGANAVLAVSLAAARAAAAAEDLPFYRYVARLAGAKPLLPLPMVNMISGGAHAGRNLDVQDALAIPIGAASYEAGLKMIVRVYWVLRDLLIAEGHAPLVGDEGGFGPALASNEDALRLVTEAIERAGLRPGADVALALDVAATQFYRDGAYYMEKDDPHSSGDEALTGRDVTQKGGAEGFALRDPSRPKGGAATPLPPSDKTPTPVREGEGMTASDLVALVEGWAARYPLVSVEDVLGEDDWEGWRQATERLGARLQLIGDDLFTTDAARIRRGVESGVANAVLIKANQTGTLTGTLHALRATRDAGYRTIVSARSGETEDDWLADLAVGSGAGQLKVGSVARSERLAKYNRLLRITEELGPDAPYAGSAALRLGELTP